MTKFTIIYLLLLTPWCQCASQTEPTIDNKIAQYSSKNTNQNIAIDVPSALNRPIRPMPGVMDSSGQRVRFIDPSPQRIYYEPEESSKICAAWCCGIACCWSHSPTKTCGCCTTRDQVKKL